MEISSRFLRKSMGTCESLTGNQTEASACLQGRILQKLKNKNEVLVILY